MKISTLGAPVALLAAAALTLSACAANEPANPAASGSNGGGTTAASTLAGKGASSMSAAQQKWIADYQSAHSGVTINYSPDGSGAGREAFISGAVQYAGSDRPFKDEEQGAGKFGKCSADSIALDLPVYVSPIAVVFNVDGVTDLKLDADTLAGIFAGKITKWNDPKIAANNSGAKLPDASITAVHRADDSGTTNNFTDYLNQAAPSVWTEAASDTFPAAFGGESAKGTSAVVDAVKTGKNTIGYADASAAGELGHAKLKVGNDWLSPTAEAAAKIVDSSQQIAGRSEHDLALKLNRKAAGVYPAVLVSYALVCQTYSDAKDAELVKGFIGYVASSDGQKAAAKAAGSAPLSSAMQAKVKAAIDSIK
ncbi:MAG: phosphate ABC transporter substrate-binding protein PstS [Micropruina sp.]|uniref:phosphate ABC transporter substrate-binding protein PstS n=1 Tax=Micropruina sp. TaxID=2737536 RepID=UPI0039E52570